MISIVTVSDDTIFEVKGINLLGVEEADVNITHRETRLVFDVQYGCQNLKMNVFNKEADVYWNNGKKTRVHINRNTDARLIYSIIQTWRNYFLWHLEEDYKRYIKRVYQDVDMKRVGDTVDKVSEPLYGLYDVWPRGQTRSDGKKNHLHFKLVAGFDFWKPKTISRFEIGGVKKVLDQNIPRAFFEDMEATAIQTGLEMQKVLSR